MMNTNEDRGRHWPRDARVAAFIAVVVVIVFGALGLSRTRHAAAGVSTPPTSETPAVASTSDARAMVNELSTLFEGASQAIAPSVVPIFSEQVVELSGTFGDPSDLLRQFFGGSFGENYFGKTQRKQTVRSLGSGVIVSKDGLILTNNHVVRDAQKLTVRIDENKEYDATVVGTDPLTDVAVIKIDAKNLPAARMGDSDNVKVGQWVIAVGNPFQLLHTVTAGIISATGRSSIGLAAYEDFIQTDASINPGNSGGALCDLNGNVIGINTAITSPSGANAGIGFAIPINMAKQVMDELVNDGKVSRGYLALVPQDIDESLAQALDLDSTNGALVGDVMPDGPADNAGIERGDVIVAFDGKEITNSLDLRNAVAAAKPGSKAKVDVVRNGHHITLKAVLAERPVTVAEQSQPESPTDRAGEKTGMHVQTLTPDVAGQLGYEKEHGVVVAGIDPGSPAESAGLRRGDLIEQVNNHDVSTVNEFADALSSVSSGDSALLLTRRGEHTFFVAVRMS